MTKKPVAVSHDDLWEEIQAVEKRAQDRFKGVLLFVVPLALSGFVWTWNSYAGQQAFNADINARTQGNQKSYTEARETQHRIEQRLDEIQKFLREDSREMREALREHIKEAND